MLSIFGMIADSTLQKAESWYPDPSIRPDVPIERSKKPHLAPAVAVSPQCRSGQSVSRYAFVPRCWFDQNLALDRNGGHFQITTRARRPEFDPELVEFTSQKISHSELDRIYERSAVMV